MRQVLCVICDRCKKVIADKIADRTFCCNACDLVYEIPVTELSIGKGYSVSTKAGLSER